jgi:hypothetical protein
MNALFIEYVILVTSGQIRYCPNLLVTVGLSVEVQYAKIEAGVASSDTAKMPWQWENYPDK